MKSKQELEKALKTLNDLLEVQKNNIGQDEYMLGMYNGMEFVLSCIEGREVKYEKIKKDKRNIK